MDVHIYVTVSAPLLALCFGVQCENNYTQIGRSCYKMYTEQLSNTLALRECKRDNASLVVFETEAELKAMGDFWNKNFWDDDYDYLTHEWYRTAALNPDKTDKWIWNWNNLEKTTNCTLQESVPKFIQKRINNSSKKQTLAIRKNWKMKWEFKRSSKIWTSSIYFICETIPQMPDCGRGCWDVEGEENCERYTGVYGGCFNEDGPNFLPVCRKTCGVCSPDPNELPPVCRGRITKSKRKWDPTVAASFMFVTVAALTFMVFSCLAKKPKTTPSESVENTYTEDLTLSSLRQVLTTETTATRKSATTQSTGDKLVQESPTYTTTLYETSSYIRTGTPETSDTSQS